MNVLLDTSIILNKILGNKSDQDVKILFKWLDRSKSQKVIHARTVEELRKTEPTAFLSLNLSEFKVIQEEPAEQNADGAYLLNTIASNCADLLISEDVRIHAEAKSLNLADRVLDIDQFLEKVFADNPEMVDYKVLNVQKIPFGKIDLDDSFFLSLKKENATKRPT